MTSYERVIRCIEQFQEGRYPNPHQGAGVIGGSKGEGVSKAKIFKGKHEAKLEFSEGWG